MGTVVVGVDGSSGSRQALRFAVEEARLRGARLRAVTAWHIPPLAYSGGYVPPFDPKEFEQSATAIGEKALAEVETDTVGLDVEHVAAQGQAAQVLLDEAEGAELLVVGSRGHGGFTGLLLGSVGQQCAHHARCPVVIVNEPAARG